MEQKQEQEKKKENNSKSVNSALERIIELTAETVLRTFSGVMIFLILDGLFGLISGSPFMTTGELYRIVVKLKENFGSTETLITIYALLWGWGRVVYILRQLILDRVKGDYLTHLKLKEEKEEETIGFYGKLREEVLEKLKKEFKVELPKSDYLIYNFLGKILSSETSKKRTRDADEIAFLAVNVNLITLILAFTYEIWLLKILYTHYNLPCACGVTTFIGFKILAILAFTIIIVLLTINLAQVFAAKRLISRNLKLYINYLYLSKDYNDQNKRV